MGERHQCHLLEGHSDLDPPPQVSQDWVSMAQVGVKAKTWRVGGQGNRGKWRKGEEAC